MEQINRGWFKVINPYNRRVSIVPAIREKVHTIVFWSKNFGPFLEMGYGERLTGMGYNLFFNFTINSDSPLIEPNVPQVKERLYQMKYLCRRYDTRSITWRFDPVCFFKTGNTEIRDNLNDFSFIAKKVSRYGVGRCITSFLDFYPKIQKRISSKPGFSFIDPSLEKKIEILCWMKNILDNENIALQTCCEKKLLEALPAGSGITASSCIPNNLLKEIFSGNISLKKDAGQRIKNGCGCMVSVDIGSYNLHPCYHNCLFCYANPSSDAKIKQDNRVKQS